MLTNSHLYLMISHTPQNLSKLFLHDEMACRTCREQFHRHRGGDSSVIEYPPLVWKVGCSTHGHWVNRKSVYPNRHGKKHRSGFDLHPIVDECIHRIACDPAIKQIQLNFHFAQYDEWSSDARDIFALCNPHEYHWSFLTLSKQGDVLCRRIKKRIEDLLNLCREERPKWFPESVWHSKL